MFVIEIFMSFQMMILVANNIESFIIKNKFTFIQYIYSNVLQSSASVDILLIVVLSVLETVLERFFWNGVQLYRLVTQNRLS